MSTTIILTSNVNVNFNKYHIFQTDKNERIFTYIKSILQWLQKTNLNIVLVENSGYNFNELNKEKELYKDRFEVITFNEKEVEDAKYLENNKSKGDSELFSIYYAFRNSNLIKSSNFIIKVTCRFFIPEFEDFLSKYNLNDYDCLTQYDRDRCEIVGSHYKNFLFIFDINTYDDYYIENVWKKRTSEFENILICKKFEIEKTQRGGVNQQFTDI